MNAVENSVRLFVMDHIFIMNFSSYFYFLPNAKNYSGFDSLESCWSILPELPQEHTPWRHPVHSVCAGGSGAGHYAHPHSSCSLPAKALLALSFSWFICAVQKPWPEMCPWFMGACTSLSTRQSYEGGPKQPCGVFSFDFCIFPLGK